MNETTVVKVTVDLYNFGKAVREIEGTYAKSPKGTKHIMSVSVLQDQGCIQLRSCGETMQVVWSVQVEKVNASGNYVVNTSKISQFIGALSKVKGVKAVEDIELILTEKTLEISGGSTKATFELMDNDLDVDFIAKDFEAGSNIQIPSDVLADLIKRGGVYKNDRQDIFTGYIHFRIADGIIRASSGCERGLSILEKDVQTEFKVPKKQEVNKAKLSSGDDGNTDASKIEYDSIKIAEDFPIRWDYAPFLNFDAEEVTLKIQEKVLLFFCAEDTGSKIVGILRNDSLFKDIGQLLSELKTKSDMSNQIIFSKSNFSDALDLASCLMNSKFPQLKFKITNKMLSMSSDKAWSSGGNQSLSASSSSTVESHCDCEEISVDDNIKSFTLNAFDLRLLQNFGTDSVSISFAGANNPFLISGIEDRESFYLVTMPFPEAKVDSDNEPKNGNVEAAEKKDKDSSDDGEAA